MKNKAHYFTCLAVVAMTAPAAADIIYGSLQQTIPTDYTGVTINVGGGTLNPFFGGAGVANNNALQPFRQAATGLATIKNFGTEITIDTSSGFLATGAGGSLDHVGTTFTAGTEGYVGFKLNAANYGWMRVVLTNNTSGGIVKDWAYDNTGAAIKTGWINTDIVSPTAQTVTLNPGTSEAFTLGSSLADASGSITNSVLKTGAGTTTLNVANTYTGGTTVSAGKLVLSHNDAAGTGSITVSGASGVLEISEGKTLANATNHIILKDAGAKVNRVVAANTGANTTDDYTTGTAGNLKSQFTGGQADTTAKILAGTNSGAATTLDMGFSGSLVSTPTNDSARRSDIFTISGTTGTDAYVLQLTTDAVGGLAADSRLAWLDGSNWVNAGTGTFYNAAFVDIATHALGSFGYDSSNKSVWAVVNHGGSFSAIPEPTSALAGLLIGAGLLRRRRNVKF